MKIKLSDEFLEGLMNDDSASLNYILAVILARQAPNISDNIQRFLNLERGKIQSKLEGQTNERHSQLQYCSMQLQDVTRMLDAAPAKDAMWLQFCYELSFNTEDRPADFTDEVCNTFKGIDEKYGNGIARALYEMPRCILPAEILGAAKYLHDGGNIEDIPQMADNGAFEDGVSPPCTPDNGPTMG